jgi:hypothetical protein
LFDAMLHLERETPRRAHPARWPQAMTRNVRRKAPGVHEAG